MRGEPRAAVVGDVGVRHQGLQLDAPEGAQPHLPPLDVGGKSFRIRGATDVAAEQGLEGGAKVVQALGRWHSDVSHIYSRAQAQVLLDATAGMANAEGGSLESLVPGWTQPAWR